MFKFKKDDRVTVIGSTEFEGYTGVALEDEDTSGWLTVRLDEFEMAVDFESFELVLDARHPVR